MKRYGLLGPALCCLAAISAYGIVYGMGVGLSDETQLETNKQTGSTAVALTSVAGDCTNECCNRNPTPGCNDPECEALVCDVEPVCCVFEWDLACQMIALDLCGLESPSDCCGFLGPGLVCSDPGCVDVVCAADPFCCDTSWDTLCGFGAQELCGDLCCCGEDEPFEGCGELVQGVECVLFQADSGGLFLLENLGGFGVGDRVLVTGLLDPDCFTLCLQGDGCIFENTIEDCVEDDMITICHIPPGNRGNAHTITISINALPAHLAHGDTIGPCDNGAGVAAVAAGGIFD